MASLNKLYLFTHTRSFIMFHSHVFSLSFFHSKHNNVVHELITCLVSPYWGFLMFAHGYWCVYYLWQLTCCVKGWKLHTKYLLAKRIGLLLLSCSFPTLLDLHCFVVCCYLLVLYMIISLVVWVSYFFISLNICWQQSTCFLKMDNRL
jgi:hypothetical protein